MSARDSWATPPALARLLVEEFGCNLDVCADASNHKCNYWFGLGAPCGVEDALTTFWGRNGGRNVAWCNPPYSKILPWVEKAIAELANNVETIMLVPLDSSTAWWRAAMPHVAEVRLLTPRVQFVPPDGVKASSNPKASAVLRFLPGWHHAPHVDLAWDWQAAIKAAKVQRISAAIVDAQDGPLFAAHEPGQTTQQMDMEEETADATEDATCANKP